MNMMDGMVTPSCGPGGYLLTHPGQHFFCPPGQPPNTVLPFTSGPGSPMSCPPPPVPNHHLYSQGMHPQYHPQQMGFTGHHHPSPATDSQASQFSLVSGYLNPQLTHTHHRATPYIPNHPHSTNHNRKKRQPYSKNQITYLEKEYKQSNFITRQKREQISHDLKLTDRQVKIWFQNRRVKDKKLKQRETREAQANQFMPQQSPVELREQSHFRAMSPSDQQRNTMGPERLHSMELSLIGPNSSTLMSQLAKDYRNERMTQRIA